MDTQSELASSDAIKVETSAPLPEQMLVDAESDSKPPKIESPVKIAVVVSSSTPPVVSSQQEAIQTAATTLPTTVITTRPQRMITTQGHITEIAVAQATTDEYEQYQITASGDDQNVYTYEATPSGIIISSPADHHLPAGNAIIKRDMMIEKDHHNGSATSVNVVNAEPQTVYVELKNEAIEQARFIPNPAIRYESAERFHRFHGYHPPPQPPPPHYSHHQRELQMKTEAQQAQEIQIYEAEQQNHQNSAANDQNQNIHEHSSNEPKTQYTNLEPVGSSQNSYFISTTENYQPSSGQFTYLTSQPAKEPTSYVYHHATTGSPVLYKGMRAHHNSKSYTFLFFVV